MSAPIKHKWKVDPPPTGPYRSFQDRAWPKAEYPNGEPCAAIVCDDGYHPGYAKIGRHKPLSLRVANHSTKPWTWMRSKATYATLDEAKAGLVKILEKAPSLAPKEFQP